MSDCLFCKIIQGTIQAKVVHEDPDMLVIEDINPQAPVHVLVIPKKHVDRIAALTPENIPLMGNIIFGAKTLAQKKGWQDYRLVFNNGEEAGQSVFHIHLHLLSGRPMNWPPG